MKIIVLPKIGIERYPSLFPKESSVNHIVISINSYGHPKTVLPIIHGCNDAKECLKGSLFLKELQRISFCSSVKIVIFAKGL